MGRISFVAWLFVSATACLVGAAAESSWGWLIAGIVLFAVAVFALRQIKKESETAPKAASGSFVGVAILFMIVAMLFLFWLQFKA